MRGPVKLYYEPDGQWTAIEFVRIMRANGLAPEADNYGVLLIPAVMRRDEP